MNKGMTVDEARLFLRWAAENYEPARLAKMTIYVFDESGDVAIEDVPPPMESEP